MSFTTRIGERLSALREASRYRELKASQGVSFVDNDYLGLSTHPKVLEAGEWALRVGGAGSRGSRLLGGQSRWFDDVEESLAEFFGSPAALFFSSGYLANLGVLQSLGELADTIVSDEKNHASLIDGIRLSRRPKQIIEHNRWDQTEPAGRLLLVAESLYSMDGDFADFAGLRRIWDSGDHFLLLDEAHAAGVFAEDGRGMSAPWRDWDRMAVVVTFGKAFGVSGAAVLCSAQLREWLINSARSFIYTTAPSPVVAAMVEAAVGVLREEGEWRRRELWERAHRVREILSEAQPALLSPENTSEIAWANRSPIIPFLVRGDDRTLRFCENMRESGIEIRAIRYPTVAKGAERVRISLSLAVSRENTETMAREMVRRWTEYSS